VSQTLRCSGATFGTSGGARWHSTWVRYWHLVDHVSAVAEWCHKHSGGPISLWICLDVVVSRGRTGAGRSPVEPVVTGSPWFVVKRILCNWPTCAATSSSSLTKSATSRSTKTRPICSSSSSRPVMNTPPWCSPAIWPSAGGARCSATRQWPRR